MIIIKDRNYFFVKIYRRKKTNRFASVKQIQKYGYIEKETYTKIKEKIPVKKIPIKKEKISKKWIKKITAWELKVEIGVYYEGKLIFLFIKKSGFRKTKKLCREAIQTYINNKNKKGNVEYRIHKEIKWNKKEKIIIITK